MSVLEPVSKVAIVAGLTTLQQGSTHSLRQVVVAGVFVFGYCFYYYLARSDMSGFMQTSFFFGYMFMVCYGFFLMLGAVGYKSSLVFVRHIYR